jgi:hypothetical protein
VSIFPLNCHLRGLELNRMFFGPTDDGAPDVSVRRLCIQSNPGAILCRDVPQVFSQLVVRPPARSDLPTCDSGQGNNRESGHAPDFSPQDNPLPLRMIAPNPVKFPGMLMQGPKHSLPAPEAADWHRRDGMRAGNVRTNLRISK